jgi:hypothetical protein
MKETKKGEEPKLACLTDSKFNLGDKKAFHANVTSVHRIQKGMTQESKAFLLPHPSTNV